MEFLFFNLLFNSSLSFYAAVGIVSLGIWIFKINSVRYQLYLLSLPFFKIIFDIMCGIPTNSILISNVNPYFLPPEHQQLSIGFGFSKWGPLFYAKFSATDASGVKYSASLADYLLFWIQKTTFKQLPIFIVTIIILISSFFVIRRIYAAIQFEKKRRHLRETEQSIARKKIGLRTIDIYESKEFSGTPFTGGLLKPYICVPQNAKCKLISDEFSAVIAHEVGHIKFFDLPVTLIIRLVGDIFWFIPGYQFLVKKIDRLREISADQYAERQGISGAFLASALLKLSRDSQPSHANLYSAFFREKSLLKERMERLLQTQQHTKSRFGWQNAWIRPIIAFWMVGTVAMSTFGGNHDVKPAEFPVWVNKVLSWISAQKN